MSAQARPASTHGREQRAVPARLEVRTEGAAGPTIVGRPVLYNTWSQDLGGFKERIMPGAAAATIRTADIRALVNHDPNYILGRTRSGTVQLAEDSGGVTMRVRPPDTTWASDLLTSMRRGDIDQMSFAFKVVGPSWNSRGGGTPPVGTGEIWNEDYTRRDILQLERAPGVGRPPPCGSCWSSSARGDDATYHARAGRGVPAPGGEAVGGARHSRPGRRRGARPAPEVVAPGVGHRLVDVAGYRADRGRAGLMTAAVCTVDGCPARAVRRGMCDRCYRARGTPTARGYGAGWRQARAAALPFASCEVCGCRDQLQRDHRVPRSRGGSDHATNLRFLCDCPAHRCHSRLGAKSSRSVAPGASQGTVGVPVPKLFGRPRPAGTCATVKQSVRVPKTVLAEVID